MTTYAELTTQILNYTEVSTDVLSSTITDDFIEHVENRILRDVDLDVFKSNQTANLVTSNAFLSLPGGTNPTPTSLATIRSVHIYPASGTATRTFLEQRDISFMNEYWPVRTSTSTPKYWAWWDHNSWLSNNAPAAMLYGCLAEAFKFLKGPAEMLQLYEQSYQRALQELAAEQQGRHRRDEYMHGALRLPMRSTNP